MWIRHPEFLQNVRLNWNTPCHLYELPKLFAKLKRLKGHLKWWNRDVFGNIIYKITEAEKSVRLAEAACEADPLEHCWNLFSRCNEDLAGITAMEADFWKQKAACNWLEDGERNTNLFHNMVKNKRVTNNIFRIWEDGTCLTSPDLIQLSGAAYFQHFSGFSTVISEEENVCIAATTTFEEVRSIVFSISRDSVAGPDVYSSVFFQHCWDFVQQDVMDAVLEFFQGSPLLQGFTATTITLVPKVEGAHAWMDFCPIILCNFPNKIISKLLYSRLRSVVGGLISQSQSGFVPGRMIFDNILLTQELTHSLNLPARGGNAILKLDMAKAYDKVQWSFLLEALRQFGFSEQVVRMVHACIYFCKFLGNVNGTPAGLFGSTKGLRQGDPLSPVLFIIVAEYLSRSLDRLFLQNADLRYRSGCDMMISHLAYADDVIICANGGSWGMQRLKDFLAHYENCSGQLTLGEKVALGSLVLCLPPGERRGTWFSSTEDIVDSFSMKLCGAISPTWHRMLQVWPRAKPGIRWRIGYREVSFWDDTWLGDTPLSSRCGVRGDRRVCVSSFLSEGAWDFDILCAVVAPSVAEEIAQIPILVDEPDVAIWIHNTDGAFSVRYAWEQVRPRGPVSNILIPCWGHWMRPTMSFFLWRFWHRWLPMDEVLQQHGFAFASICQCCEMSETLTHIFIDGPNARSVRHFFGAVFWVRIPITEDFHLFLIVWKRGHEWSPGGNVKEFIPFVMFWFLWTPRNDSKNRHLPFSAETVKFKISSYLRLAHSAATIKLRLWLGAI
ncbi:uncharacterized protein [Henckelia pumila]|uniref:uncharacterized protein n=1 Tax=Henckelia pumila TaxID=405737 RepID=UPI003C6DC24A